MPDLIRLNFEGDLRRTFPATLLPEVIESDTDTAWGQWDAATIELECSSRERLAWQA